MQPDCSGTKLWWSWAPGALLSVIPVVSDFQKVAWFGGRCFSEIPIVCNPSSLGDRVTFNILTYFYLGGD